MYVLIWVRSRKQEAEVICGDFEGKKIKGRKKIKTNKIIKGENELQE
jgi:hypothetical protein